MEKHDTATGRIGAVVTAVPEGKEPFVVAYPEQDDKRFEKGASITFTLKDWKGDPEPQSGQMAELKGIRRFKGGWRAASAQPIPLENQQ